MKKLTIATIFVTSLLSTGVYSSGFQVSFQSVSSFSRGAGGAGVAGDDLADIFYNPAGIRLYKDSEFQFFLSRLHIESNFTNTTSSQTIGGVTQPSVGASQGLDFDTSSGGLQYVHKTNGSSPWTFGASIAPAFGNENKYDTNWIGRRHALVSDLEVFDYNAIVGYEVNEKLSLGAGISFQTSEATLSQATFTGTSAEPTSTLKGDDTGFGFNLGAMYEHGRNRFGISYRSYVKHTLDGRLTGPFGPGLSSASVPASADITFPETIYLSGRFPLTSDDKWVLSWTSRWTRWSRNQEINIVGADGNQLSSISQNWNDVWLHGLGLEYKMTERLKLRTGLTIDSTPIPSPEFRTPRQPEGDRVWISVGASYAKKNWVIDVGYQHAEIDDASINRTIPLLPSQGAPANVFGDTLTGEYTDAKVDVIAFQFRYKF